MTLPPILEQIQAIEDVIRSLRQSYTNTFGEHKNTITDPIAARDIAKFEGALETLSNAARI